MARKLINTSPAFYRPQPSPYAVYRPLLYLALILAGVWIGLQLNRAEIQSPFDPTPTPTRSAESYVLEAQAYFQAGKLSDPNSDQDAIDTYRRAVQLDPTNAAPMAELARILAYSSRMVTTDQARLERLEEARDVINQAAELEPDDSTVLAIQAFVLDWNASSNLIPRSQREAYLAQAETAANRAYFLDPNNALALAFYAEVLLDQQKWDQALEYAGQAVERRPDLMDTHRVYGTVLESVGLYNAAIEQYKKASELAPNMTFLLLQIGLGYRNLALNYADNTLLAEPLYNQALEYFDRAAQINKQLGVEDPQPYIAIAKTYTQQGQFFIASRNAETALRFSPTSPDTYGQLGMIYVQARNYESALPALMCAIEGCSAEENKIAQDFIGQRLLTQSYAVAPLPLTNLTVAYYYIRYGSVLAFLSEPDNDYADKCLTLMAKLRQTFPEDEVLMQNAEANEINCRRLLDSYGRTAP